GFGDVGEDFAVELDAGVDVVGHVVAFRGWWCGFGGVPGPVPGEVRGPRDGDRPGGGPGRRFRCSEQVADDEYADPHEDEHGAADDGRPRGAVGDQPGDGRGSGADAEAEEETDHGWSFRFTAAWAAR